MVELIKKEDAIEAVTRCCPENSMYRAIRDIPSVDAADIVRCEHCEKYKYCDIRYVFGAEYCSLAIRKGE